MWVFGYGSLMCDDGWETAYGGSRVDRAVLMEHRRSFNKKSVNRRPLFSTQHIHRQKWSEMKQLNQSVMIVRVYYEYT